MRGMRVISGEEAKLRRSLINQFSAIAIDHGYQEVVIPAVWEQQTFIDKAGEEILNQMYGFEDKGGRSICLIPEATAVVREVFKNDMKHWKKPIRLFYVQRCYRYERPQEGRYREFTQFGVECLGENRDDTREILTSMLDSLDVEYALNPSVKRGLDYYVADGFEAECATLGAQKQIAGGGTYDCGEGFAIGLDRVMLAINKKLTVKSEP